MSVFDLDPDGRKALDEQARMNALDATKPPRPGLFTGSGEASKSLLVASAEAGRTVMLAGSVAPIAWDAVHGLFSDQRQTGAQDWYFGHVVEGLGNTAVDAWTPDATQMGAGAKVLGTVGQVVGSIPQMVAAPELFLANSALSPAIDLTRRGVGTGTALGVGGLSLAVNAAGFKLPAAFGRSLTTRLATGIGTNVTLGAANDAATAALLQAGGYDELARNYDWANMKARGLDTLMGAAFGGVAHVEGVARDAALDALQRQVNAQRGSVQDALMTQLAGEHFLRSSLPGDPSGPAAVAHGQKALASAISQILRGDRVNVSDLIKPDDFVAPTQPESYVTYRRALESGGNPAAANPRSSAVGIDQFTAPTWLAMVDKVKPAWAQGLSRDELLAARTDPAKSGEIAAALDAENATALEAAGVPVDNHSLYAAHHFGADTAVAFSRAAPDTPVADILTSAQIKANPYLKDRTKAQVLANWDARAAGRRYTADAPPQAQDESDTDYARRVVAALPAPKPEALPDEPARYFDDLDGASLQPIDSLISSKTDAQNARGGKSAAKYMAAAGEGVIPKRPPLDVRDNGDGTYTVLDGNGTLTAAKAAGFAELPVRVVDAVTPNKDLRARYERAARVLPAFRADVRAIADFVDGRAIVPGLKGVQRASAKVVSDYRGDASKLKDLVRATIEVQHPDDAERIHDIMQQRYGKPVKWNNTLTSDRARAGGYRDANSVWTINGEPVELQINVPEMLAAKEKAHGLYAEQQALQREVAERGDDGTPEEMARDRELTAAQEKIYAAAWEAAKRRMNSSRERGVASSSYDVRAMRRPEGQSRATMAPSSSEASSPFQSPNSALGENAGMTGASEPFVERSASAIEGSSGSSIAEQATVDAATQAVESSPGLQVQLDDGRVLTAAEALAEADREITQAATDAQAFAAAATCAMRYDDEV